MTGGWYVQHMIYSEQKRVMPCRENCAKRCLASLIAACMQIGLWDVKAANPLCRNVPVFPSGDVMCPLEDVVPLRSLLAPLDTHAEQVIAAIDGLQPRHTGLLGLGPALHALLDYLVSPRPFGTVSMPQVHAVAFGTQII
jgi:hypothetical protein